MKKILITGAAGFVGRHSLLPLLEAGMEIHALDLKDMACDFPEVFWHRCDLNDHKRMGEIVSEIKAEALLHFAWFTRHGEYWSSNENFKSLLNSYALIEAFADAGGKRIVMSGTCAEYAWNGQTCSEATSLTAPATVYGQCKLAMFNILQAFALTRKLSWAWGRLFFLFGPFEFEKRLVASLIGNLISGPEAPCSHGNQIRDFMSSVDAGAAFAALLNSQVEGAVNIASGIPMTIKELALLLEKLTDRPGLVKFGQLPTSPDEPASITADISRLKNEVGWQPRENTEQRLHETIEWWKQHGR
ncbi:MAG: NAD-dependent epimerase/dehydratase family protein [Candidatus Rifleibacteriota bacterium]